MNLHCGKSKELLYYIACGLTCSGLGLCVTSHQNSSASHSDLTVQRLPFLVTAPANVGYHLVCAMT